MFEGVGNLEEAKVQVPMLVFQVVQMGMGSLGTLGMRWWVDRGEKRQVEDGSQDGERDGVAEGPRQEGEGRRGKGDDVSREKRDSRLPDEDRTPGGACDEKV